jgi:DNA-binding LacI/PurR family transcriptional regulator
VPVTIKDVARVAGVSVATVSRALSNAELVHPETRERVRQAATELGYQPSRVARGLSTGRTGNIGLIVPDLANPFFASVVKGMQARARELDMAVFVTDTDEDPKLEFTLVRALSKQVDGLIIGSPRMSEDELRSAATETPLVLLNRRVGRIPAVTVDNVDGMRQAVAHLVALGHRRIGYVEGPRNSWANRERLRGLRAVISSAGVEFVELGSFLPQFEGGVAAADQVLAAGVSAVVTYNDLVALGLLSRFTARGVDVPGRISIVGCDDIVASSMVHPALTTISLPKEQTGRAGVDLLLQLMEKPDRATGSARRELPVHLLVRGSTGPAAVHDIPTPRGSKAARGA